MPSAVCQNVLPLPLQAPRGVLLSRRLRHDPAQSYFLYVPKQPLPNAPLFISVHGITRNADEHAAAFAGVAERLGMVLIAPLFCRQHFPNYQRLGKGRHGQRPDIVLQQIIAEVSAVTDADSEQFYLFGYSGGGQFVHRYLMAYPQQVRAAVVAAAGWYTFPDALMPYPYGIGATRKSLTKLFRPEQFLQIPVCVMVGECDVERDAGLRAAAAVDRQQGVTRVERGRRWVHAMRDAAKTYGFSTRYDFATLPRSDHSFTRCVRRGQLPQRVYDWLIDIGCCGSDAPEARRA